MGVCLQLEAEAAQLEPEGRAELLEGLGLGEGVVPRVRTRRVPPARPAHVPHHRRHRVAGVDVPRRRQGARVRGRDPLRPAARLHPGRGDLLTRSSSTSVPGPRRRNRASCGSRGRTTRSSTATCSRSASTCDGARWMSWLVRDGDVLAAVEVADTARGTPARAARPRRVRRRAGAAPVSQRAHRAHALRDRRRVLRRRGCRAADGEPRRRGGCRRTCTGPRS